MRRNSNKYTLNKTVECRPGSKKILFFFLSVSFSVLCIMPVQGQEDKVSEMKIFYQNHCVKCHGLDGSAVGEDGKKLKGQNFTDTEWQRETEDEEMVKTIMKGKFFGLAMPSFKDKVTEQDAQLMVTDIIRKSEKGKIIKP
jgi:mono/diheme cytochrome c family protein